MKLSKSQLAAFDQNGVICLPQLIDRNWQQKLAKAVEKDISSPGPYYHGYIAVMMPIIIMVLELTNYLEIQSLERAIRLPVNNTHWYGKGISKTKMMIGKRTDCGSRSGQLGHN